MRLLRARPCVAQVSGDLRASVQRAYVDTLRRMDGALTNICSEFDPDKYTKVRGRGRGVQTPLRRLVLESYC